jgi:hypothetical protein
MSPVNRIRTADHNHGLPVGNFVPGLKKQQYMLMLYQQYRIPAGLRHIGDAYGFRPVTGHRQGFMYMTIMNIRPDVLPVLILIKRITGFPQRIVNLRVCRPFPAAAEPNAQQEPIGQCSQTAAMAHSRWQRFAYHLLKQKKSHLSLFVFNYILPFPRQLRKKTVSFLVEFGKPTAAFLFICFSRKTLP